MSKKVARARDNTMTKITTPVQKPTKGGTSKEATAFLAAVKTILNPQENKTEEKKPV